MRLRTIGVISSLVLGLLAAPLPAGAQETGKIPRIGFLASGGGSSLKYLRKGLRELGYVEGENIVIEKRAAKRKHERLPALADELLRLKVDVLFASSMTAALAAKKATTTIPIVFVSPSDPVAVGLVDSLAKPGGNVTGLTHIMAVLVSKRLQLLKEVVPNLSRVAALWQPGHRNSTRIWKETQLPAQRLGLQLHSMEVRRADEFEGAFQKVVEAGASALAGTVSALLISNKEQIANLAIKNRLPSIYVDSRFARAGGLLSYGTDRVEEHRRAARYVDEILKGAKPADLPVEQPKKFELVVNLKTAKLIGVKIPSSFLYQADKVIK